MKKYHFLFSHQKTFVYLILAGLLSACSTKNSVVVTESITIDGSSTVYPITDLVAKKFSDSAQESTEITVDFSGSISGFEKFCRGETDINNASVPIPKKLIYGRMQKQCCAIYRIADSF